MNVDMKVIATFGNYRLCEINYYLQWQRYWTEEEEGPGEAHWENISGKTYSYEITRAIAETMGATNA